MSIDIRPLTADDGPDSRRLGQEAFGVPTTQPEPPSEWPPPGQHPLGAFDDGRLVAKVVGKEYRSYFGGVEIPTWGISGVTVEAEARGAGLLTELFRRTFDDAKEYGAAVSTLFPTAPGIYRKFGYELIGEYTQYVLPTTALAAIRPGTGVRVRRATAGDVEAIRAVYRQWAQRQHGPLTRTGPCFPTEASKVLESFTGVSVAVDGTDRVVGYVSWERGQRVGAEAAIEVEDLIGLTPDALRALARLLGSFATVAASVKVEASGFDVGVLMLPGKPWQPVDHRYYMMAVLDPIAAVELRRYPTLLRGSVGFSVAGSLFGQEPCGYHVDVADGRARCTRTTERGLVRLTRQGLSLAYAGAQSVSNLRLVGHAEGGDPADDASVDSLFAGRPVHIRDFF